MYICDPTLPPPVDDIIKGIFDSKRSRTSSKTLKHLTQIKEETWVLENNFFWRELLLCQDPLHTQWGERKEGKGRQQGLVCRTPT